MKGRTSLVWRWCAAVLVMLGWRLSGEEIWLCDNTRLYGLVESFKDGKLKVQLPDGEAREVPLEDIIAVSFRGRPPLLIQTGTQELRFVRGGQIRGEILGQQGNSMNLISHVAGYLSIDLECFKGFVALPAEGFSGRKAMELVESAKAPEIEESDGQLYSPHIDWLLDKRGSRYPGSLRKLERTRIVLDHEELLQQVPVETNFIAGVRLADKTRKTYPEAGAKVLVRIHGRDGSRFIGELTDVHMGLWSLHPAWDEKSTVSLSFNEIVIVQVLNGRVQYLSQLDPVTVQERTTLVPPQSFRRDASCKGDRLAIAGRTYPWGLGVHAHSELTFKLSQNFKTFRSAIGIASSMEGRGSVVFQVFGDGKELYHSPVVKGSDPEPLEITVPVAGVDLLKLQVSDGGDLDLGDAANWGSARLLR